MSFLKKWRDWGSVCSYVRSHFKQKSMLRTLRDIKLEMSFCFHHREKRSCEKVDPGPQKIPHENKRRGLTAG